MKHHSQHNTLHSTLSTALLSTALDIAHRFIATDAECSLAPYGSGNINDTFLVTAGERQFILQRLNGRVFSQPEIIGRNLRTLLDHVQGKEMKTAPGRRWELPRLLVTNEGADYVIDQAGAHWRSLSFVAGSRSLEQISGPDHARETGYVLGKFHRLISDLPPEKLQDPLPGFHDTPACLRAYTALAASDPGRCFNAEELVCRAFIAERQEWCQVLEEGRRRGALRLRPVHSDPKISNILIDAQTGQGISIVDLDTVRPGLIQHDIGDCLRSGCNPAGEAPADLAAVDFDLDLCRELLAGYFAEAKAFLSPADIHYFYDAIRLLAFELGLRFFTDHLAGNVYFKVRYPEHNLYRAQVQFRLTARIEAQEREIRAIIREL